MPALGFLSAEDQRIARLDVLRADDDRFDRELIGLEPEILRVRGVALRVLVQHHAPPDLRLHALDAERHAAERARTQTLAPGADNGSLWGHGVAMVDIERNLRIARSEPETDETRPS